MKTLNSKKKLRIVTFFLQCWPDSSAIEEPDFFQKIVEKNFGIVK